MEKTTEGMEIEVYRDDEDEAATEIMRDRFRLCTISIAEAEARRNGMEISQPIMACISDLAFKYAEQVARDLELFAHHAGRKSVNMEDVILCAHRNNHLAVSLRSFCNDLKAKELPADRKRRKRPTKETDVLYVPNDYGPLQQMVHRGNQPVGLESGHPSMLVQKGGETAQPLGQGLGRILNHTTTIQCPQAPASGWPQLNLPTSSYYPFRDS